MTEDLETIKQREFIFKKGKASQFGIPLQMILLGDAQH